MEDTSERRELIEEDRLDYRFSKRNGGPRQACKPALLTKPASSPLAMQY